MLTVLHAGGKFGQGGYKVSGGLHGVGAAVVNALSTVLIAEVRRDRKVYQQEYRRGEAKGKIKVIGTVPKNITGTTIRFQPDPTIFTTTEFSLKEIYTHLRQQAYLTKGVRIDFVY